MSKYVGKFEKTEIYAEKYDLEKDEVFRILSSDDCILSFDELKIKYDNPEMGILPSWITEEELSLMLWKSIHTIYDSTFSSWITKEDLYGDMQLYIRKKINLVDNHRLLKAVIDNRIKWTRIQYNKRKKYHTRRNIEALIEGVNNDNNKTVGQNLFTKAITKNNKLDISMAENIRSIKDKSIREVLVVVGYLVCNIVELGKDFKQILDIATPEVSANIKELIKRKNENEQLELLKASNISTEKRIKRITFSDIIKAMKYNTILAMKVKKNSLGKIVVYEEKSTSVRESMEDIRTYLLANEIL